MTGAPPAVEISSMSVDYGEGPVLSDLDLDVADREVLALLGPSGCGKTTLLRTVAGFVRPVRGSLALAGRTVAGDGHWVAPERRNVGLVPQEGALFPHLDVGANVAFGLIGVGRAARARRVAECLELVGLPGIERRRPRDLSGGQQQRIALARALAPEPSVVLLDEPFSALDATLRARVRDEVRDVLHQAGATAVLVTHDQEEALSFAERVAVVHDGRIAQVADPASIYHHPVDLHVAEFVGESFRLLGHIEGDRVTCELGTVTFHSPPAVDGHSWSPAHGEAVTVLLRPEQVTLSQTNDANRTPGRVESVTYYGHDALIRLRMQASDTVILSRTNAQHLPATGEAVEVSISGPVPVFSTTE